jgi:hypothetical protein
MEQQKPKKRVEKWKIFLQKSFAIDATQASKTAESCQCTTRTAFA